MDHFLSGLEGHHSSWYSNRNTLHNHPHEFAVGTNSFQLIPLQGPPIMTPVSSVNTTKTLPSHSNSTSESTIKFSQMASAAASLVASVSAASAVPTTKVDLENRAIKEEVEALEERNFDHLGLEGFSLSPVKSHHKNKEGKKSDTKRVCNICGKILSRGDKLKNHIRIHTNNFPYHCATCGQGFLRSEGLRIHTRIHTGERPYVCVVCGKAYTRKDKLTRHAIIHTGERPFVCRYCEKSFTRKDKMQRHELIHKVEKPWTCVPCNLEFVRQEGFNAHMEKKHPERLPYTLIQHQRPAFAVNPPYRPPIVEDSPLRPPVADSPPSPGYIIHEGLGSSLAAQNPIPAVANNSKSVNSGTSREELFNAMDSNIKTLALLSSRLPPSVLPHPES